MAELALIFEIVTMKKGRIFSGSTEKIKSFVLKSYWSTVGVSLGLRYLSHNVAPWAGAEKGQELGQEIPRGILCLGQNRESLVVYWAVSSGQVFSGSEMGWWSAGPILESTGGSASLTACLCRGVCRHDHTLPSQEEDRVLCDPDLPTLYYDGHPVPGLLLA